MSDNSLAEFDNLELADPDYYKGGKIDIIIGAAGLKRLMIPQVFVGSLLAQKPHLGWLLSGAYPALQQKQFNYRQLQQCNLAIDSDDSFLRKFWETEEKIVERNEFTAEERVCDEFYSATTTLGGDGRYVCRLPFKSSPDLGHSRHVAVANFLKLEKGFFRDPKFKERYCSAMEEYFSLGHAQSIEPITATVNQHYSIPHLAVIKETSSTTTTRIVFNASSPSSNGKSLNDNLMVGPTIQRDLVEKVISFRLGKYVFVCDIVKMYRQINIHPTDWTYQRFVWRRDSSEPIKDFTVTFGTSSAPYTAIRTLAQLAADQEKRHPVACKILATGAYVDDIHYGAHSIEEAKDGLEDLISVLASASFEARKFVSNHPSIVADLPKDHLEANQPHKIVGIVWDNVEDVLSINTGEINSDKILTKRKVLTQIASLFDPLGWVQPVIVPAKVLMQEIWKANLEWDQLISEEMISQWKTIVQSLNNLKFLKIPRWMAHDPEDGIELHGFADASQLAYGAVIYAKLGTIKPRIFIVVAKSRVAPLKIVSIPRLELKVALLLSDLMDKVYSLFVAEKFSPYSYGWSDSKVTLAWIDGAPEKWKPFVRNRVAAIQESIIAKNWKYVPTALNPADILSRGCTSDVLKGCEFWFNGPEWLYGYGVQDVLTFNHAKTDLGKEEEMDIQKEEKLVVVCCSVKDQSPDWVVELAEKFSNFGKSGRVLAWVRRFVSNCRTKQRKHDRLSNNEVHEAESVIVGRVQKLYFSDEISDLKQDNVVNKTSVLYNLNPYLDNSGLVRVQGRIQRASIPFDQRHPMILPFESNVTRMIIHDTHLWCLHGGAQLTLALIRKKFWIVKGLQRIKSVLRKCVPCFKAHPRNSPQLMGTLSEPRVNFSKAFLHTGVDFAGPFRLRLSSGRGTRCTKGYIAVFVCMAVKAIHLEVVSALTSDAFIAALLRFRSRRGTVSHMYSDNGTNFVGAFRKLCNEGNALSKLNIEWSFNPP